MSKVIVIKNCWQCVYNYWINKIWLCAKKDRECPNNGIPDWCPLPHDLPSSDGIVHETEYQKGFYDGFCDCLDDITGKENKNE